jgi:hypothetical protein
MPDKAKPSFAAGLPTRFAWRKDSTPPGITRNTKMPIQLFL